MKLQFWRFIAIYKTGGLRKDIRAGVLRVYIQRYIHYNVKAKSKLRWWNVSEYQLNILLNHLIQMLLYLR